MAFDAMAFLNALGVALEAVGAIIAILGIRETYRRFAAPGAGILDPERRWLASGRGQLSAAVLRVRRRLGLGPKARTTVALAGSATGLAVTGSRTRVRVGFGRLTRLHDHEAALVELDRRTRDLDAEVTKVRRQVEDEVVRMDQRLGEERDLTIAKFDVTDERLHDLATGGARLQLYGFGMVIVGLILQGVASLWLAVS